MDKQEISFYSAGHRLVGYWYPPKTSAERAPAVICGHGFSAMIDVQMVGIPESLSEAGFGALTYYSRGLGESEGPRGRVLPWEQVEDMRNAITYLQTRPDVDPARIGVFGSAWGCSIGVVAMAVDARLRCLVGTVGIGDCERWLKSERPRWEWAKFLERLEEDRRQRVLTGRSTVVHPNEIHIPDRAASKARDEQWNAFIKKSGYAGYPLETAQALIEFKPETLVHRIAPRPVMFIHMEKDVTVPVEESISLYEKAGEPKKLVVLPGRQHYDTFKFTNPEVFGEIMSMALDWYGQHLSSA
ncbi:MAG: alpha/beta hydrolase [Chloroflexota bacterium]|nr:alpha/beta hydrolase [Chloroflexota bacterium]